MAKSLGNFYTLRDVVAHFSHINPTKIYRAFRLMTLQTRYRESFNFSFEKLQTSLNTLDGLDEFFKRLQRYNAKIAKIRPQFSVALQGAMQDFVARLEDDFSTPEAIAGVFELVSYLHVQLDAGSISESEKNAVIGLLETFDAVFAIFDWSLLQASEIPVEIQNLLNERLAAKKAKNFALADEIRTQIKTLGYAVLDTEGGSTVEKI